MVTLGKKIPESEREPNPPTFSQYLLRVYNHLHSARASSFGTEPISYTEIRSYCLLMNIELSPWEVEKLREMDDILLKAGRIKASVEKTPVKVKSNGR